MKIAMLVLNNCVNDSRVLKQATTLSGLGHDVRIYAIATGNTKPGIEKFDQFNYDIFRLELSTFYSNYRYSIDSLFKKSVINKLVSKAKSAVILGVKLVLAPIYFPFKYLDFKITSVNDLYKADLENTPDDASINFFSRGFTGAYFLAKRLLKKIFYFVRRLVKKVIFFIKRIISSLKRALKLLLIKIGVLVLVPMNKISLLYSFQRKVQSLLLDWNPDVVHAHDLNTLGAAHKYCEKNQKPFVYDSHELWVHRNQPLGKNKLISYFEKHLEKKLIRKTYSNITVSNNISKWLAAEYNIQEPLVLRNIPHSYDDSQLEDLTDQTIKSLAGINSNDVAVLFTGRISQGRGLETVIKALKSLPSQIHFCMLGYGNEAYVDELRQLAANEECMERVHFLDAVAPNEVTKMASTADLAIVFIEPVCLSYKFCLPNKLFESIQARLPVVINDLPDMRQLVEKYDIGVVAETHNLVERIQSLLANKSSYRKNLDIAAQELNWEKESKKLISLYEDIGSGMLVNDTVS